MARPSPSKATRPTPTQARHRSPGRTATGRNSGGLLLRHGLHRIARPRGASPLSQLRATRPCGPHQLAAVPVGKRTGWAVSSDPSHRNSGSSSITRPHHHAGSLLAPTGRPSEGGQPREHLDDRTTSVVPRRSRGGGLRRPDTRRDSGVRVAQGDERHRRAAANWSWWSIHQRRRRS